MDLDEFLGKQDSWWIEGFAERLRSSSTNPHQRFADHFENKEYFFDRFEDYSQDNFHTYFMLVRFLRLGGTLSEEELVTQHSQSLSTSIAGSKRAMKRLIDDCVILKWQGKDLVVMLDEVGEHFKDFHTSRVKTPLEPEDRTILEIRERIEEVSQQEELDEAEIGDLDSELFGLSHEPSNEQEVVFLFARCFRFFGITKVVKVRLPFPDAVVFVKQGDDTKGSKKYIEFELSSGNFYQHGHLAQMEEKGIKNEDLWIVCWKDDWQECPLDIKVIEMGNMIEDLGEFLQMEMS